MTEPDPEIAPQPPPPRKRTASTNKMLAYALFAAIVVGGLAWEVIRTGPVRRSLDAYNRLISVADQGDLAAIRGLCSTRYLRDHPPRLAPEGGLIGLPHYGPHKNFKAWRRGDQVLLCPTNRVGPVYRFIEEGGTWRFDGPVGLLMPDGRVQEFDTPLESEGDDPAEMIQQR